MEPLKSACMALMMMTMTMTSVVASDQVNTSGHQPLTADGRIADILNHPAFAGFASLILPWDGRDYDETMWLGEIGALQPYHSHVRPDVAIGALNRLIEDVNVGRAVFYDVYTEAQSGRTPRNAIPGCSSCEGGRERPSR